MGLFNNKEKHEVKKTVDNPYLAGRQEWLEQNGSIVVSRNNWKLLALLLAVVAIISVSGNVYQGIQVKIIPYIVEVDKLGRASAIAPIDDTKRVSLNHVVPSVLSMVITDWRTVTADIELQKRMIRRLSYFTTGAAKGYFSEWYKANNPYERGKDKLVTVELKSLPLPITDNSYKAEWTETTRNHAGEVMEIIRYEATITT